ncbi:MAG TPA: cysteine hydrolase family protein [Alphaproteobacteria bacterium]
MAHKKALLVIDMNGEDAQLQGGLTERLGHFAAQVQKDMLVVFVRMQDKSGWSHIPQEIRNRQLGDMSAKNGLSIDGQFGVGKPYADAFNSTHLGTFLHTEGVQEIYCSGLWLNFCVSETALGAIEAGFKKVSVIKDMTDNPSVDNNFEMRARASGIKVVTAANVVESLKADKSALSATYFPMAAEFAEAPAAEPINQWARRIVQQGSQIPALARR